MQVIPENLNITTGYHVFETPDDIIINSQIYDKVTMEPKPYNFFNTNYCLNNKNLLLHEVNILEYPWAMIAKEPDYRYYIQDTQDSDIFYCVTERAASNQNQYILKLQRLDTGWKVLNTIAPDSGYRYGWVTQYGEYSTYSSLLHYKLLGQTNDYIVLTQTTSGHSYEYNTDKPRRATLSYLIINKLNMTIRFKNINVYYDYSVYLIKETNDSLYLYENLGGRIYIIRFDPYTNTRTVLFSKETYADSKCIGISNIIKFNNKYYILTGNSDNNYYAFQELTIDFKYNKITCVEKTLEQDSNFLYHYATSRTDFLDCSWLQIDLKNVNNTYISITIHDNVNKIHGYGYTGDGGHSLNPWCNLGQTVSSAAKYHRHILYKYDKDNDKWISKGIIAPDEQTQHIYGVLYYDDYTPIFLLNTRIIAYRLNLKTEKYEKCFEKAGTYYTIGLDENNKFYMFDSNNNCSIYNDVTSYELFAKFEHDSYNYTDGPIDTYVSISSKNFLSEYINTKVELILEGNCKFTENNKKTLITHTQSTGKLNVPVTVTNGGTMYCYIKEVE